MIFPAGRETLLSRFPWATALLMAANTAFFFGTWPGEKAFFSVRWPDSSLVSEAKALAALALDGGAILPADLRTRFEDLRARPDFPDEESDRVIASIQKNFDYLPTFKRPDWDLRYAAYLKVRKDVTEAGVPWRSVLDRFVFRSGDFLWPRLATHSWVHAGYLHFLFSLFFLWLAGSFMEEVWGSLVTLLIYVTGAAAAALAVKYILPGGDWVLLGASGATAALVGAMLARDATEPVRFFYVLGVGYGVFSLPAWTVLIAWAPAVYRMGWLTEGRLDGPTVPWFTGPALLWGLAAGALVGLKRGTGGEDVVGDSALTLNRRVEAAANLFTQGKAEEARHLYQSVLTADAGHMAALQGILPVYESLRQEDDAARTAVKIIRVALEKGRGQMAEEVFRRWSLRLFQTKISAQERLALAQNLEVMQLWREALAYYRSVLEQAKDTPFAGKALFASAKIHKEQFKKNEDAAQLLRQLLDPPYDLEWRALAEAELRTLMKL